jgi:hypothetical protein
MAGSDLALSKRRIGKLGQIVWSPTVVITGVAAFPGHEGQGRIATAQAGQAPTRAEHVHLNRLRRQTKRSGNLLRLQMRSDQPQNLALSRRQLLESRCAIDHGASMLGRTRRVQHVRREPSAG